MLNQKGFQRGIKQSINKRKDFCNSFLFSSCKGFVAEEMFSFLTGNFSLIIRGEKKIGDRQERSYKSHMFGVQPPVKILTVLTPCKQFGIPVQELKLKKHSQKESVL